eukprot:Selendium_serpulae@DN4810_c1_g1_i1.p1
MWDLLPSAARRLLSVPMLRVDALRRRATRLNKFTGLLTFVLPFYTMLLVGFAVGRQTIESNIDLRGARAKAIGLRESRLADEHRQMEEFLVATEADIVPLPELDNSVPMPNRNA